MAAAVAGAADKFMDMTVAIDKLDKIGMEGVTAELLEKGLDESSIEMIKPFLY